MSNPDRGFTERTETGRTFEEQLFSDVAAMGFIVAINGTEHTHPGFVEALHQSTDQTSLSIRFQPDAVVCIGRVPRSLYVEAKAAITLEKTAYEQYMKLHYAGNLVAVVFGKLERRWNFVECVKLVDGQETVLRFPENRRFPVAEGWIYPRRANHWGSLKQQNYQASGTPYREVDSSSLRPWLQFRDSVIERLQ